MKKFLKHDFYMTFTWKSCGTEDVTVANLTNCAIGTLLTPKVLKHILLMMRM